jgi:hypothetical protein
VVSVEDNGNAIDWCYAPDVVGCCNGSSNAGLLVLVYMALVCVRKKLSEHVLTVDTLSGEEGGLKDLTVSLKNFGFQVKHTPPWEVWRMLSNYQYTSISLVW